MARNVGHICNTASKWCQEGADEDRHDKELPWDHPSQHNSHQGGCICSLGEEPLSLAEQIGLLVEEAESHLWTASDRIREVHETYGSFLSEHRHHTNTDEDYRVLVDWEDFFNEFPREDAESLYINSDWAPDYTELERVMKEIESARMSGQEGEHYD